MAAIGLLGDGPEQLDVGVHITMFGDPLFHVKEVFSKLGFRDDRFSAAPVSVSDTLGVMRQGTALAMQEQFTGLLLIPGIFFSMAAVSRDSTHIVS